MKNKDGKTLARAHNTDAFDVSATGTTIQDCVVDSESAFSLLHLAVALIHVSDCFWAPRGSDQDDCLAVNKGSDIKFLRNSCNGQS
jgi:hypothetical protein